MEGSCDEVDEEGEKGNDEKVGQPIGSSPENRESAREHDRIGYQAEPSK